MHLKSSIKIKPMLLKKSETFIDTLVINTSLYKYIQLFIHLFIPQNVIECIPHAKDVSGTGNIALKKISSHLVCI